MPVGDKPGWKQIFTDDFTTDVALGSFPAAVSSKWSVYPSPWKDSSGYGTYSPSKVVDVSGGTLNKDIHTESGVAMVAALAPKLPTNSHSGLTYGRFAVRFRTDSLTGYKMAWLLWPDSGVRNEGEIDWPEANLDDDSIWGFMHRTNPTYSGDQAWFNAPAVLSEWHTTVIEWSPNLVVYFLDGVEVGRAAERVPSTSMHWILQTETELDLTAPPSASVRGDVQIDWVAVYAFDPSTADTTAPALTVTAPAAAATLSGAAVTVSATASDSVGVEGVQFKLDGANLGTEDTTVPYGVTWNTLLGTQGSHTLTAVARDNAGNTTSRDVAVTVTNVSDTTAPRVIATVPQLLNGTIFPPTGTIWAGFDEAVVGVTGTSFSLENTVTGTPVPALVTYKVTTTSVKATLDPTGTMLPDTSYTATLTTAIKDTSGNPLAPTSWTFLTGPAPTFTTTPSSGATAVSTTANVTTSFNENVTGANDVNFTLKTAAGTAVAATVAYSATTRTATLDPTPTLAANTTYTATVTTAIKDVAGNPIGALSWSFTTAANATADTTKPQVTLTSPVAGAVVSGTIQLGATATDLNGVRLAKWYVDGIQVGYDSGAVLPWAAAWDTRNVANGAHRVFAKASDPSGNWGSSPSITVIVSNP